MGILVLTDQDRNEDTEIARRSTERRSAIASMESGAVVYGS